MEENTTPAVETADGALAQTNTQPAPVEQAKYSDKDVNGMKLNWEKELLKKIGAPEDIQTAKEGYAKLKEWQESQRTEAENTRIALEQAQNDLSTERQRASDAELKYQILKEGIDPKYEGDILGLAKLEQADSMEAAVKAVIDRHPEWKPQTTAGAFNPAGATPGGQKTKEEQYKDRYDDAVKNGNQVLAIQIKREAHQNGVLLL